MSTRHPSVRQVLAEAGRTYCEQAGFTLKDTPSALYQLVVLATLLAKPISPDLAVAAAGELRRAGVRTPAGTLRTTWQERVDALGRGHYRRYDESTATILEKAAVMIRDEYRGDLRRLGGRAERDPRRAAELLTAIPGIGGAGADVVLREAQRVWPWLRPYVDDRTIDGARRLGFAHTREAVARLLTASGDEAAFAAALVRATVEDDLAERLRGPVPATAAQR